MKRNHPTLPIFWTVFFFFNMRLHYFCWTQEEEVRRFFCYPIYTMKLNLVSKQIANTMCLNFMLKVKHVLHKNHGKTILWTYITAFDDDYLHIFSFWWFEKYADRNSVQNAGGIVARCLIWSSIMKTTLFQWTRLGGRNLQGHHVGYPMLARGMFQGMCKLMK